MLLLIIPEEDASIFTVSENGYGKRSKSQISEKHEGELKE